MTSAAACTADRGRARVLEAEEAAFGGTVADEPRPWSELIARAERVTGGSWWMAANGPEIELRMARSTARASTSTGGTNRTVVIRIARDQRTLATVAHELAHALAGIAEGHGERFRAAEVDVVTVLASGRLGEHLRAAFAAFDLAVGDRRWPAPSVGEGPGFVWRHER